MIGHGGTRAIWLAGTLALLTALPAVAAAQGNLAAGEAAAKQSNQAIHDAANGLEADMSAAMRQLMRLAGETGKLREKWKDAKKKGDDAERAADMALKAAKDCKTDKDKKRVDELMKDAAKKADDAKFAKDMTEIAESGIKNQVDDTITKTNQHVSKLGNQADQAIADAKKAGLKDNSAAVGNLTLAKAKLEQAVQKVSFGGSKEKNFEDIGPLAKLQEAKKLFDEQFKRIREGNDPSDALRRTAEKLKQAAEYAAKCPTPISAAPPQQPVDVYVAVDNRPKVNVCIAQGQNPDDAVNKLGLDDPQTVVQTPDGTVVQTTTDAQTVEQAAKDKKVQLCFKPEGDFCLIFTPLTAFRGHDHGAHRHAGRGPHDHDAPDPPLTWGVTPPTPVFTLEPQP